MAKLRWLKINEFRWVKPGCLLRFDDRLNFVLGKNGTGKTTLLDLIGAVWSGSFAAYAGERLDVEYEFELEYGKRLKLRVINREGEGASVGPLLKPKMSWELNAALLVDGEEHGLVARPGEVQLIGPNAQMSYSPPLFTSSAEWSLLLSPFDRLSSVVLSSVGLPINTLWWTALTQPLQMLARSGAAYSPGKGWQIASLSSPPGLGMMLGQDDLRYSEGQEWAQSAARSAVITGTLEEGAQSPRARYTTSLPGNLRRLFNRVVETTTLSPTLEVAPGPEPDDLLDRLTRALGVHSVSLRFDLELGEPERHKRGSRPFRYHNLTVRITKKDGTTFLFDRLSHGQKRLFGLYWYLASSPEVVIADELANGLHYTMVEQALKDFGERQAFLATQDPLLLYPVTFDSLEQVQRRFVICETIEEDGLEWWVWRQLRDDEAQEFYEGYQAGIEHVPDILRSRGLW